MVAPEVNKEMLADLQSMGFSMGRATRALHFSGKHLNTLTIMLSIADATVHNIANDKNILPWHFSGVLWLSLNAT
jgi:hypothetical protein